MTLDAHQENASTTRRLRVLEFAASSVLLCPSFVVCLPPHVHFFLASGDRRKEGKKRKKKRRKNRTNGPSTWLVEFASGQFVFRIVTDRLFPNSFPIGFLDFEGRKGGNFPIRRQFLFYPCPIGRKNEKNIGEEYIPPLRNDATVKISTNIYCRVCNIRVGLLVSFLSSLALKEFYRRVWIQSGM